MARYKAARHHARQRLDGAFAMPLYVPQTSYCSFESDRDALGLTRRHPLNEVFNVITTARILNRKTNSTIL
ncbi:uncharacterized protein UMAG_12100 [Mycosarcoma maydis]|uniref:Uncharacterized protein n=1 Tax=Mycosarcoma maydis TaxID=5270 RepID=A0A0D1E5Q4_MYCMD|nr:uncharacterized protein UMAG_12100 [Ustilago maydis 521]KIS69710.1 hypothetical protein UMAG_12100 [Ustilago maydis 521]|eukprot:XP_011388906.1 hypothetical protein UMAG_12100 [Ustilago maydis 521]